VGNEPFFLSLLINELESFGGSFGENQILSFIRFHINEEIERKFLLLDMYVFAY
jgi:hypothetical protein